MKLKLYSMAIVFILLLVGCNNGQNDTNNNDNIEPTRYNDNNINDRNIRDQGTGMRRDGTTNINNRNIDNRNIDNRNNTNRETRYEISKEAADRITDEIQEIHHAYVLTTDNNAYVAAVLDNDDRHEARMNNRNNTNRNNGDLTGERNINDGNLHQNRDNRDEGAELTNEVKDKIADIVRSVDRDIDNVYVTTNPDFADLTHDYMNDFHEGKPVRGFFDQIGNMIERVFPQNKR